jgi:TonB-dependent SusC/RagA subfamily outer membrane receptor
MIEVHGGSKGVYIRGVNSFNLSSEALYVLDGSIVRDLNMVNPCDIVSIDVIKDGTSAIYGMRGANGVVVIETK